MPLGTDLKDQIAKALNIVFDDWGQDLKSGSREIVLTLKSLIKSGLIPPEDIDRYRASAAEISATMPFADSIDEYLERHSDDKRKEIAAKLAITKSILDSERASSLFSRKPTPELSPAAAESWLSKFLNHVTRGCSRQNVASSFRNLTIITFNYDRCFEQFCFLWLKRFYHLPDDEAAHAVACMKIYHPYGKVGALPFQNTGNAVRYGARADASTLMRTYSEIKTYSEAADDTGELETARAALIETKRLIFLGFAFHDQNFKILQLPQDSRATMRCYATTMGISKPRLERIEAQLQRTFRLPSPGNLFFEHMDATCESFWQEYSDVAVPTVA